MLTDDELDCWPQAGWTRPTFDVPSDGVVQRVALGDKKFWRQDTEWSERVAITEAEYDEFVRAWQEKVIHD